MLTVSKKTPIVAGVVSALAANIFLGVSSIFWKSIGSVGVVSLVCYRVFLSCLVVLSIVLLRRRLKFLYSVLTVRVVIVHCVAAAFIAINWWVFIGASVRGYVLESGIGYLIAPLVSIGFGVMLSKERLSCVATLALGVVFISVMVLVVFTEALSAFVYLNIGFAWGAYMYLKKISTLDAFDGLLIESVVLSVLCLALLYQVDGSMSAPPDFDLVHKLLLLSCGFVSLLPLVLLSFSARRLDVIAMGFFQYVLPLTLFAVSVGVYRQPLSTLVTTVLVIISGAVLIVSFNMQFSRH